LLLHPRHPDQHQSDAAPVEDGANRFQARHLQAVRLVHQHQVGRVRNPAAHLLVFPADLAEGRAGAGHNCEQAGG
jgi:hypothetical protein